MYTIHCIYTLSSQYAISHIFLIIFDILSTICVCILFAKFLNCQSIFRLFWTLFHLNYLYRYYSAISISRGVTTYSGFPHKSFTQLTWLITCDEFSITAAVRILNIHYVTQYRVMQLFDGERRRPISPPSLILGTI